MDRITGMSYYYRDNEDGSLCTISREWHDAAFERLALFEDVLDRTGLSLDELEALAQAKRESCDTCRQKQDGGSWLFCVYPCRECKHRVKSHYEAAEAALNRERNDDRAETRRNESH